MNKFKQKLAMMGLDFVFKQIIELVLVTILGMCGIHLPWFIRTPLVNTIYKFGKSVVIHYHKNKE